MGMPTPQLMALLTTPMKSPKISSMLSQEIHIFSLSFILSNSAIDLLNCSLIWSGVIFGSLTIAEIYWIWLSEESLASTIDW